MRRLFWGKKVKLGLLALFALIIFYLSRQFLNSNLCTGFTQLSPPSRVDTLDMRSIHFLRGNDVDSGVLDEMATLQKEMVNASGKTRPWLNQRFSANVKAAVQKQRAVLRVLSQPVINHHDFGYIHNPRNACVSEDLHVLFVVPTAVSNFAKRQRVRRGAQGVYAHDKINKAKVIFFLGVPSKNNQSESIQAKIDTEVAEYGDIVQDNFTDTYKNIRLKAVSMLKWATTFCPQTKFVVRTDDDVTLHCKKVIPILGWLNKAHDDFIVGTKKVRDTPVRNSKSKWFLSKEEFPPSVFPDYVIGGLIGYPISTVNILYEAALRIQPIWLDDVYITGICAGQLHIPRLMDRDFTFRHYVPTSFRKRLSKQA